MRSCPQCKTAYPDEVSVCARDGAELEPADDYSRPIEPTASIAPPAGTEDISLGGLSGASFQASSAAEPTRAGHPRAGRTGNPASARPAEGSSPGDRVGSILGSYRLVEVIGRGGMGSVYRAEHVRLPGREVALKLLRDDYAKRKDSVARFIREAQSVNRIRHRNIVDVSDIVELDDGTTFIIMELLRGDSLGKLMRKPGELTTARNLSILMQICDGLAAAHEKEIVHRDLKPDNIFVSADVDGKDLVKLLDFGVAKLLSGHEADVTVHTVAGAVIGTPAFMSPEQAGGLQVDSRSDIYSLGAIMYELFTGSPPFKGKSFGEFVRKHLNENPVPLRQTKGGAHVDPRIEAIVLRCLEKNPDRRYPGAVELRAALYDVYAALETHTGQFSQPGAAAPMPSGAGSLPPQAPPSPTAGPAALTYTPDPGSAPFPPMNDPSHGSVGSFQPTPPPVSPAGTPPVDLSGTGEGLPTPPPHTPMPPTGYGTGDMSAPHPAPFSGQHAVSGPYAAVSGQHPAVSATMQTARPASWKKRLVLMLGGGALVGAFVGVAVFGASGDGDEAAAEGPQETSAASGPQVTQIPTKTEIEVTIASAPEGADVMVFRSDESMCKTPCEFAPGEVGPRVRKYVVVKEGYKSSEVEINLDDPPEGQINLELEPLE